MHVLTHSQVIDTHITSHPIIVEAQLISDSHLTSQKVINKKDFFSSLIENERQKQVRYSLAHQLFNSLTDSLTHVLLRGFTHLLTHS